jgi:hypothetical protein
MSSTTFVRACARRFFAKPSFAADVEVRDVVGALSAGRRDRRQDSATAHDDGMQTESRRVRSSEVGVELEPTCVSNEVSSSSVATGLDSRRCFQMERVPAARRPFAHWLGN